MQSRLERAAPSPRLPECDFATLAVDLAIFASHAEQALLGWREMQRRGGATGPGVEHTLDELTEAALRAGQLRMFFAEMVPHEELMRDFVAGLAVRPARPRAVA